MLSLIAGIVFGANCNSAEQPEREALQRRYMVNNQIKARGIKDERVIAAMTKIPRHLFLPESYRNEAYEDRPVAIGQGQTISQPYIVAYMTEALELSETDRVLEIGTGSGYQAAVLAEIVNEVYTIELLGELSERAQTLLVDTLEYTNIQFRIGNGYNGWPEFAPFDAIIITAAPESIPDTLVDQLAEGGRIIVPVGSQWGIQSLTIGRKMHSELTTQEVMSVRFVPMVPDTEK